MKLYNIRAMDTRELMLGQSVRGIKNAEVALRHYTDKIGQPYPNGKGFYPDRGYAIVEAKKGFLSETDLASIRMATISYGGY